MLKNLMLVAAGLTLFVGVVFAGQNNGKVTITAGQVPANDGKQMFTSYCTPCHGVDGKGHGPVASVLNTQPVDLTLLSKNNHGKFPSAHVVTVLQYGSELPAHGSKDMPIWGPLLGNMDKDRPDQKTLRIGNLSRYLESIQAK
jgi:mono/diheme cytochrome c family protein